MAIGNLLNQSTKFKEIGFLVLAAILFLRVLFDTDFGWHMMVGKYIWEYRAIPQTDIFTFSAPDYEYVYHSWLSEVILYLNYSLGGLWGVTLFYALIGALILWIMLKTIRLHINVDKTLNPRKSAMPRIVQPLRTIKGSARLRSATNPRSVSKIDTSHNKLWIYWYLLLTIPLILDSSNLRIQLWSFVGLSLIYYLYLNWISKKSKSVYFIPLVFIIWVNLHAGFIVGICLLILIFIFELVTILLNSVNSIQVWGRIDQIESRKLLDLLIIIGLSILGSLINPYYYRAYQQAWLMGTNQFALTYNSDWYPIVRVDAPETFIFTALLFTAMLMGLMVKSKLDLREKLLMMFFFILSLKNRRFVVPLLVVLIPSFAYVFVGMRNKLTKLLEKLWPINKLFFPLFILVIITPALIWIPRIVVAYQSQQAYTDQIQNLSTKVFYPYDAVEYIKQHPLPERVLNDFNWGGYLVWQIPEIKTFIDGRMDNFIIDGESFAKQYLTIVNLLPGWEGLLVSHQFDAVLLAPHHPIVELLKVLPEWELVYEDDIAVIFRKS